MNETEESSSDKQEHKKSIIDVSVKRTVWISCSHYLPEHSKCGVMHGHNYKVVVDVVGPVNDKTGMVMDFHDIDIIIGRYDHKTLNDCMEEVPTAENLAIRIAKEILADVQQNDVTHEVYVEVWETCNSVAEVALNSYMDL